MMFARQGTLEFLLRTHFSTPLNVLAVDYNAFTMLCQATSVAHVTTKY